MLIVDGVSKTYGAVRVLHDVGFAVDRGRIHALIGANGSGKSTLVKILAGVVHADDGGTIATPIGTKAASRQTPAVAREAGIHVVHQDGGLFLDMTVAENLSVGAGFETTGAGSIRWGEVRRRARLVLERFEIDAGADQPLAELRPAERMMVAIARALQHQEAERNGILVLDEPTASLSVAEVTRLLGALRRYAARGQSVLFITHRLDEVVSTADTVTVLRDGRHLTTQPVAGLRAHDLAALVVGREIAALHVPPARAGTPGDAVLRVDGLCAGPLEGVSFTAGRCEILGIAGLLGSGRTRLLRAMFGEEPIRAGRITVDGTEVRLSGASDAMRAGLAFVPEDRAGDALFADMEVRYNLSSADIRPYWKRGLLRLRHERDDAAADVARFGIVAPSVEARMTTLSGGNQQKVVLARWLRRQPRVLLLDEPSQGVDVGARAEIHALVRQVVAQGATAVVVSSDIEELSILCDRILILTGGGATEEVAGPRIDPAEVTRMLYQRGGTPR